ncbi:AMP-dependent synthetase and ligase family protein [Perilla frutescens var. hirtella]|uniref:AMP-dependent synthetase and ligase family protein n=1 Tax=Perilla frutescens var. hirtella TaxID=608512 RepID=A0AAD4JPL8_PERFH|nr:AMP-dependent synthetase and ligase family protein [Perilla frutescens var. hirtella]
MNTLSLSHSNSCLLSSSSSSLFQENPTVDQWQKLKQCCKLPICSSKLRGTTIKASLSFSSTNASPALLSSETKTIFEKVQPRPAANSTPLTPLNYLERAAVVYGDCPSILYNDTVRTWSETHIRCLKLASSIASLGIRKRDVVSVVAPNIPAMCELHFAVPMSGAVLNTINLRLDANAISNLLQHSGSKLVFADCQSESLIHEAISMFPSHLHRPILVLIGDDDCDNSPTDTVDCCIDYENMVESGDSAFEWVRPDGEWDPITLNYTSGTTSSPKGVLHSHRGAFLMSVDSLLDWSVPKQPVYLWTLPMFHANGWSYAWGMAAVGGVNVCLRRVDALSIYQAIDKYKVTHMCGAPVVLNMLTNYPGSKPLKTPVHIMTAGAPPPAAVLGRAESLGFMVSHGYGLTETGGLVVTCAWKQEWNHLTGSERAKLKARQGVRSVGFGEVDVVDPESGMSVPRDGATMGEIVLRGGSLMVGYLKDEEGTKQCMRENGWFYTGDVGVMHRDGYMEVKDRSKDVIICGGENLSSVEVEAVLYTHPAVNEAAVVARPDTFWGETPCAFISLKEEVAEKPTEKEIREFCKARLPLYMVPRMVVFKPDLPKTSTGKLQKFLLRNMTKHLGRL